MIGPFELDWLGGAAASRFRRARPSTEAIAFAPFGHELDPALAAIARAAWTEGAFSEYASAAAFAALTAALLEAGAPIDLVAMAADFVVDELAHVELNARLAMTVGGAAPHLVDLEALAPIAAPGPAIARAAELAIRTCAIGENLSVPVLARAARSARQPAARAVLDRIVRDEGPHARLGAMVLAWAGDRLAPHRASLGAAARRAIAGYAPLWRDEPAVEDPRDAARDVARDASRAPRGAWTGADLGLLDARAHRRILRRALRT
ncbi:MAG: hypothetical protein K8W52_14640, partial [Deltaproteobacteria bacterium]|nr:hypothetical protein [Deltaproteobacteria bacterium]